MGRQPDRLGAGRVRGGYRDGDPAAGEPSGVPGPGEMGGNAAIGLGRRDVRVTTGWRASQGGRPPEGRGRSWACFAVHTLSARMLLREAGSVMCIADKGFVRTHSYCAEHLIIELHWCM